jgi:hypothetical protein
MDVKGQRLVKKQGIGLAQRRSLARHDRTTALTPGLSFGNTLFLPSKSGSRRWFSICSATQAHSANQAWYHNVWLPEWKTVSVELAGLGLRVFDIPQWFRRFAAWTR